MASPDTNAPARPGDSTKNPVAQGSNFDTPDDLGLDPREGLPCPPEALRLHAYLRSQPALQSDYHASRAWRFILSDVHLTNECDAISSLFVNFVGALRCRCNRVRILRISLVECLFLLKLLQFWTTDPSLVSLDASRGYSVGGSRRRTCGPCRKQPLLPNTWLWDKRCATTVSMLLFSAHSAFCLGQVALPGRLSFVGWGNVNGQLNLSYADTLTRCLRVEIWQVMG
jgi:hypothetical protein